MVTVPVSNRPTVPLNPRHSNLHIEAGISGALTETPYVCVLRARQSELLYYYT